MSSARGTISELRAGNSGFEGQVYSGNQRLLSAVVPVTSAQFKGMYAAPVALIAAPGTNVSIVVHDCFLDMTYGTAQYASGGAILVQYDSTANGAGTAATATVAAATVNGLTASTFIGMPSACLTTPGTLAKSATTNKGLYLSNQTGAFTTGDSTFYVRITYELVVR